MHTSDLARSANVHVNTIRLYERLGYLPPVPRFRNGYRRFTGVHLAHLHLARAVLGGELVGRIKAAALAMVQQAARGDLGGALAQSYVILALAQAERAQAEVAANFLEQWASGNVTEPALQPLPVRAAAELLGVSTDVLRNWERNGLISVPRRPGSRYRQYGATEIGRLRVIRMLRDAGYSMMAILRMIHELNAGRSKSLRHALDTPPPNESVYSAADRWLSALEGQEAKLREIIDQLEVMVRQRSPKPLK